MTKAHPQQEGGTVNIRHASSDAEIARCFPVMVQLRPHVAAADFVARVRRQMDSGYRLAYAEADGIAVAVAGFRFTENLFMGRHLYVDDLVTDAAWRSRGVGRYLLGWLIELARRENCTHLELDSGIQRRDAHRFYLREGMSIRSHRFSLPLK